jgi:hypothetical protein
VGSSLRDVERELSGRLADRRLDAGALLHGQLPNLDALGLRQAVHTSRGH